MTIDASAWDVKERLELMDDMGIHAQVLYPNGIGFASNHIFAIEDAAQRTAGAADLQRLLRRHPARVGRPAAPPGLLPIWDMDLTVKEMTRLLDQGMRGFTLSDKPELLGLPELPEPYFDPMWDLFNETGAVPTSTSAPAPAGRSSRRSAASRRSEAQPTAAPPGRSRRSPPTRVDARSGRSARLAVQATRCT